VPSGLTLDEIRERGAALLDALNRRDFDAVAASGHFDNERGEFHSTIATSEGETYWGLEGLRQWARNVDEIWDDFRVELVRAELAPDGRVAVELRATCTAKASGVPLDLRTGQVWTWEDGKFARNDSYSDPREAFEAAGVPY
jgi:ketosteroid isomerase-like protein